MTNINFNPSLFICDDNHIKDQSLLQLATALADAEITAWKYHDSKSPTKLKNAMAHLYTYLYPIEKAQALEILDPWISAVWWHDIAETAQDYGAPLLIQRKYWSKVRKNLRDHYGRLLKLIGGVEDVSFRAKRIADHDYERWIAHHERRFDDYVLHDATMITLTFGITSREAYEMAAIRGRAVWLHNDTHLETGVAKETALKLWWQAEEIMKEHYASFLFAINEMFIGMDDFLLKKRDLNPSLALQI